MAENEHIGASFFSEGSRSCMLLFKVEKQKHQSVD